MFLFLTPLLDVRELEALIVHEYHHICRLSIQRNRIMNYFIRFHSNGGFCGICRNKVIVGRTIMQNGLHNIMNEELEYFWEKYLMKNLRAKKTETIHDAILFGKGRFPDLMGYAAGY